MDKTWIYLWLILVDVWQSPTQYSKAIILQLKVNKLKKKHTHRADPSRIHQESKRARYLVITYPEVISWGINFCIFSFPWVLTILNFQM